MFGEENADGVKASRIKIIKDSPLANNLYSGTEYTYNGTSYTLKNSYPLGYGYYHFNSSKSFGQTNGSDWTNAGLQYYLNDETNVNSYYNSISPTYQAMIENMKYYLGNSYLSNEAPFYLSGSPSVLYQYERTDLSFNYHDGNQYTWNGKIGLMYPSDYVYSYPSEYWNYSGLNWMLDYGGAQYNWMNDNTSIMEWTISPTAVQPEGVIIVGLMGYAGGSLDDLLPGAGLTGEVTNAHAVSPVLYLKSNVITTGGDGTEGNPYKIALQ